MCMQCAPQSIAGELKLTTHIQSVRVKRAKAVHGELNKNIICEINPEINIFYNVKLTIKDPKIIY